MMRGIPTCRLAAQIGALTENAGPDNVCALQAQEFIRRFLLHVLPTGFVRIRHFGFLANCHRQTKLSLCRDLPGVPQLDSQPSSAPQDCKTLYETLTGNSVTLCPA